MVCTLNPHDNHGLREELTRLLLPAGDAAGALGVCDRYPDDMLLGTQLDRVLALFILGKHDDAAAALGEVVARSPYALPMLLAAAPKRPKGDGMYLRLGSKEEAWLYRDTRRELWERAGAIGWVRAAGRRSANRG